MNTPTQPQQPQGALITVRAQTSQLVTSIAIDSGEPKSEVYKRIYARLEALYEVNDTPIRERRKKVC